MRIMLLMAVVILFAAQVPARGQPAESAPDDASARNHLFIIYPYRDRGEWLFDDEPRGVKREPFVRGIPEMIEAMTADIPDAAEGFKLTFSAAPFEGHELQLDWQRAENGGNWYRADALDKEGWLCPVLGKYFKSAPKQLYVRADAKD